MVRVRFAPSPTGFLHIGNARMAVVNWLYALKHQGDFILRLDDTDMQRSQEEYVQQIRADLAWLSIRPTVVHRQSERFARYGACVEQLKKMERLYPCYETPEELELKRKRQLARGEPPLYDRAALKLSQQEREALEAQGIQPHWRFLLEDKPVHWHDLARGDIHFQGNALSDPVLVRSDGIPVYTLASVVDDMDMGITHILRGEDHVSNSAVQLQLFEALGCKADAIHLGHLPLLTNASGQGFSKREGSLSLKQLQEQGIEPMAIYSLLARLGTSAEIHPEWDVNVLVQSFDLGLFSRSSPQFDGAELEKLNGMILHKMSFEEAQKRLQGMSLPKLSQKFWEVIRGNLTHVSDVQDWHDRVFLGRFPTPDMLSLEMPSLEVLQSALRHFPESSSPWDEDTWGRWTQVLALETGRKGKALFLPLRLALTGMAHGPEMRLLLPLMEPEEVKKRLQASID